MSLDNAMRLQKLQARINKKQAERDHAEKVIKDIKEKLTKMGIEPDDLESHIEKTQKELEELDKELNLKLKAAEDEINGIKG